MKFSGCPAAGLTRSRLRRSRRAHATACAALARSPLRSYLSGGLFRIISCYLSAGDSNGAPWSRFLPPRAPAVQRLVARLRRALLRLVIFRYLQWVKCEQLLVRQVALRSGGAVEALLPLPRGTAVHALASAHYACILGSAT